ncbi:angiogenic factor with G patch and FHA domains 1 [Cotesia typhae]|uniref:angiogenic factor with G patch and FHA domains 1 n=1 Tax=Cotesia typhae TaxID=2053667 RepID=UPI003D68DA3D
MNSNECEEYSENEDDKFNIKINISEDFDELLKNFPEVLEFITKLKKYIKYQDKKITKLHNKLMNQVKKGQKLGKEFSDKEVQTDFGDKLPGEGAAEWSESNISEQVKQVAESTLQQSGFVYEETSGLYYDYNTGYYYDATKGLYYDGNSGIYYYYDNESKSYKYHSQLLTAKVPDTRKKEKRKKNKKLKDVAKKSRDMPMDEVVEEGECSASETSSSTDSSSESTDNDDIAKNYPPCMRIIVKETNLQQVKLGSLFIITFTGGSLGREGADHSVLIPDINISKHHARFQYDASKNQYELIDLGSRNGTYVNGKRVSVAKQESEPVEIAHGSIVQVASTKLLCHVHNGHETCGHCEPGLIQQPVDESGNSRKASSHKSELKRLKNKFGVDKDNTDKASQVARGYHDRAQARRENVGSSNQYAKTQQSSVDTLIAKDNKGFKMLSKMGWSEGQSLGKDGDGRTEPVQMVNNNAKKGLGNTDLPSIEMDASVEKKQAIWRKTRQRYDQT